MQCPLLKTSLFLWRISRIWEAKNRCTKPWASCFPISTAAASCCTTNLLVINSQSQYVGRLTIRGILTCYFPTLFDGGQKSIFAGKKEKFTDLAILMEDSFQAECKRQGALPVSQFMAPPHKSIKADMHPLHAAEIMMAENETCLPVVENQALIGVVRLIDIFRTLAGSCSL